MVFIRSVPIQENKYYLVDTLYKGTYDYYVPRLFYKPYDTKEQVLRDLAKLPGLQYDYMLGADALFLDVPFNRNYPQLSFRQSKYKYEATATNWVERKAQRLKERRIIKRNNKKANERKQGKVSKKT